MMGRRGRVQRLWLSGFLLLALLSSFVATARAGPVAVEVRREAGFVRLVFRADKLPPGKVQTRSTVLIGHFEAPVDLDLGVIAAKLSDYVSLARNDPDRRGFRLALTQAFKVNSMQAGNRLVIDILGSAWSGPPPGMPQDVVDELAREAEAARREAEALARRDAVQMRPLELEVFHANHPTFSRIQFNWNRYVGAEFTRRGDEITISFDGIARPPLASLTVQPPQGLVSVRQQVIDNQLQIVMNVAANTGVRAFREGTKYVVDLTRPERVDTTDIKKKLRDAAGTPLTITPGREEINLSPAQGDAEPGKGSQPAPPEKRSRQGGAAGAAAENNGQPHGGPTTAQPAPSSPLPVSANTEPGPPATAAKSAEAVPMAGMAAAVPDATTPVAQTSSPAQQAAAPAAAATAAQPPVADNRIGVTRSDNSVELTFPFPKQRVAAAIFQRGRRLWVLIDESRPVDTAPLEAQLKGIVDSVRRSEIERGQMFEFSLSGPWLTSVSKHDLNWSISIGDLVTGISEDILPVKQNNRSGQREIFLPLQPAGRLHFIRDSMSGDNLAAVTATAPARNVRQFREYVDVQLFNTIHGVAVRPLADEVSIELAGDGVHIGRTGGLRLAAVGSTDAKPEPAPAQAAASVPSAVVRSPDGVTPQDSEQPAQPSSDDERRAALRALDFRDDIGTDLKAFVERTTKLEQQAVDIKGRTQREKKLLLARHWLSHGFGPEAAGLLELLHSEQVELDEDPLFRLMSGIAQVQLHRPQAALRLLQFGSLENNAHASLWRGLAEYQNNNHDRAVAEFRRGAGAMHLYLPEQQAEFRLAAAESSLQRNALDEAGAELDKLPEEGTTQLQQARARFLEGRILELQNRPQEAMRLYSDVVALDLQPITSRAVYHLSDLRLKLGEVKLSEGIETLERLSIVWRGDETEMLVLNRLADLYIGDGRYDDAFNLMESALRAHPDSRLALALQDRMKQQFRDLFLNGKADKLSPIKALALFYDHKQLTPPGRIGDEMIRLLTDRLVAVDLLDKAGELLEHQIGRRLKGAGRAQVAIRLAMIQLMQRQPNKALDTLYKSSQPNLPAQVKQARKILEARAFADLGRSGAVLELLADDTSEEAEQIKSLALWNAKNWVAAGEQYEKALKDRWQREDALSGEERNQVLRAAIAFTLGGDTLGTERIRDRYGAKMAAGSDAAAFRVITDPLQAKGAVIEKMARDIADIDTLEAFIKAFRQRFDKTGVPQSTSAL